MKQTGGVMNMSGVLTECIYKDWQRGNSVTSLAKKYNMDSKEIKNMLYKTERIRLCKCCGNQFKALTLNQKYCDKYCSKYFQNHNGKKHLKRDKSWASFDDLINRLRQSGKSYAQWQKERTLELLKGA